MIIKPYAVYFDNDAILLLIRKDEVLSKFATDAASRTGQVPLDSLHITLYSGSFDKTRRRFNMPDSIPVVDGVFCVTREDKASCFLEVTEEGCERLDRVVKQLLGENFIEKDRKYHVSLSNLKGAAEASVGRVWNYQKIAV